MVPTFQGIVLDKQKLEMSATTQTGRTKQVDHGMEKKIVVHQEGTPLPHQQIISRHKSGYSWLNVFTQNDRCVNVRTEGEPPYQSKFRVSFGPGLVGMRTRVEQPRFHKHTQEAN